MALCVHVFSLQHLSPTPPKWLAEVRKDDHVMINGTQIPHMIGKVTM